MTNHQTTTKLQSFLQYPLILLLFLLPFPTIWLTEERFLNGVKWEYGTLGIYATEMLLWAVSVLFIIWYWKNWKLEIRNCPPASSREASRAGKFGFTKNRVFALACLALISYLLLSTTWSLDHNLAWQQARRVMGAFILGFMLRLGPLTFSKAAGWFVAGATLQSLLGIWQFLTQSTFAFKWLGLVEHQAWQAGTAIISGPEIGRWLRAYGAFPHPNVLGGYLVVGLILTTLLWHKTRSLPTAYRLLPIAYCLQSAALFFTFSRSAWLTWVIWIVGWLIWHKTDKTRVGSQLSIVNCQLSIFVVLAIIFFPLVRTRISGTAINEQLSATDRLSGYHEAGQLFRLAPWLGVGPGHYTLAAYALAPNRPGWEYQPTHNVALLMLVELGIIGVSLFGAVIILVIISSQGSGIRDLFFLISLFSFLPIFLLDHYLYSTTIGLLMSAVYLALICRNNNSIP